MGSSSGKGGSARDRQAQPAIPRIQRAAAGYAVAWMVRRSIGLVVVLAATGAFRPVAAEPRCAPDVAAWQVESGELLAARSCGAWLLATDSAAMAFSYGAATLVAPVAPPYEIQVTMRRVDADRRSIELVLGTRILLLQEGKLALYRDDNAFNLDGWHDAPAMHLQARTTVRVRRTQAAVEVWLDGVPAGRWSVEPGTAERIGVAVKGHGGVRARLAFSDLIVTPLGQGQRSATSSARPK